MIRGTCERCIKDKIKKNKCWGSDFWAAKDSRNASDCHKRRGGTGCHARSEGDGLHGDAHSGLQGYNHAVVVPFVPPHQLSVPQDEP